MKFCYGLGALPLAAALTFAVSAQTTTAPSTCKVAPTTVTALNFERQVTLSNVLSTFTPNAPANVLAAIAGGGVEVRERLVFNPQLSTITSTIFTVSPGSVLPTPLTQDITQGTLTVNTFRVDEIRASCSPVPSVLFIGTITSAPTTGLFAGNLNGATAALSVGFTTDSPPKINNVAFVVAGVVVEFSPAASGTLTFPPAPATPPGTSGGPNAVIRIGNPPANPPSGNAPIQVFQNPFHLDALASTTGSGVTFTWTSDKPVDFIPSKNSATPDVQFQGGAGDYKITLTVTDATGASKSTTITIQFTGH